MPTDVLLGTGMAAHNPDQIRQITCPFTGRSYHAVEAAVADFTVLHGYIGDEYGNVQFPVQRDSDDIDPIMAKAAERLIVTVEKIVPHEEILRRPNLTYIPHLWVEAIVEAPFGAHPLSCDGYYDEDAAHMEYYQACSREDRTSMTMQRTISMVSMITGSTCASALTPRAHLRALRTLGAERWPSRTTTPSMSSGGRGIARVARR